MCVEGLQPAKLYLLTVLRSWQYLQFERFQWQCKTHSIGKQNIQFQNKLY